jgi:acyl-CoA synthetase (AMP-forming)/AMP-acid ligase II
MTRPLDFPPTVPKLVRCAADRFATRDYVITPDRRLTFADAEARSRRLAKRLLESGVGKGTRVAMLFPQGADFVVAFLAITRTGAIAVPLSTFARPPELRRAIRHVDVAMLLAPPSVPGRDTAELFEDVWPQLRETREPQLFLEEAPYLRSIWLCGRGERPWATVTPGVWELDDESAVDDRLLASVESEVTPADALVIVTTSGATAEPKAVVHTHGAEVGHAWTMAQLYELTEEDRTFTNMPFFWVGGLTVVVLSHLHVGAAVVTVERMDSTEMLDLIENARATRLLGWTLFERLSADPTFGERDLSSIVEMRPPELAVPGTRHNSLGMTETSGPHTAASRADNAADLPEHLRGSFGPPVPGMHHKIVDPDTGDVLADGVEGEICVRGPSLMDARYKKERRDTFDEDGWYHTQDKGLLREGLLFFTGRLTEMIKTGGANVAPREVELAIEALPGVKAAFVVGLPDAERGEQVGCLVCNEPGVHLDPASLIDQLRDQLASYKIPRKVVVLPYDDAPWLPTGKVSKPRIVELLTDELA